MLAGNMGEGAKHTLEDHHIRVIRGCSGSVEAVVNAWLQGAAISHFNFITQL